MNNKIKGLEFTPAGLSAIIQGDLENAMVASTPGGIEAQEADGQRDFIVSETLPTKCPREKLESLGFVFGEAADDIFTYVQFPEGWKKEPTEHSMWSDLLDDKGRKRGSIFYKAAFYDRNAHMNLVNKVRYSPVYESHDNYVPGQVQCYVTDGENILFETVPIKAKEYSDEYWIANITASDEVQNWLEKHYPDYNDPMAYWD